MLTPEPVTTVLNPEVKSELQIHVSTTAAAAAVAGAVQEATRLQIHISVAVVDASGLPVAFLRMHRSPLHSISIAEDKAYTAASFGVATDAWSDLLKAHSRAVRAYIPHRPRFTAFGGGLPLCEQGVVIGGVGVSGGTESEDEQCAQAGIKSAGFQN